MSQKLNYNRERFYAKSPLAINIIKLQSYRFENLEIETIIIYEWIIVKAKSFKYKEFYYPKKNITAETGVKRRKLEKALKELSNLGIVHVKVSGLPPVTHFFVDFQKLVEEEILKEIYIDEVLEFVEENFNTFLEESNQSSKHRSK